MKFIYSCMNSFALLNCNILELCQNFLTCHKDTAHEHSFQCVTHTWHFDTRSNTVDGIFNEEAGVLDYS
jgi:hypothetical protein